MESDRDSSSIATQICLNIKSSNEMTFNDLIIIVFKKKLCSYTV